VNHSKPIRRDGNDYMTHISNFYNARGGFMHLRAGVCVLANG
jgi:hypothetical protein